MIRIILLLLLPVLTLAQFTNDTKKRIDIIENNNSLDVTINPINQVVIPYLNEGELVIDNGTGLSSLNNGAEGQLLSITSGELSFIDPPASSPLTTKGDLYTFDTDNQRLGLGLAGQILSVNLSEPTGLEWIDPPVTSPTTTEGDLIIRGATEDIRIPIGLTDYLLTSDGTTASWQPAPVSTTLDTKGQIQTYSTENAALDVGLDGQFLVVDSDEPTGLKYTSSLQGKLNPVTDWVSYTPTNTQGLGAISDINLEWRRVGDSIELRGSFRTGTVTSDEIQLELPNSYVISSKVANTELGSIVVRDSSTTNLTHILITGGDTFLNMGVQAGGVAGLVSKTGNTTLNSSQKVSFHSFTIPIQGWTSGLDAAVQNIELTAQTKNEFFIQMNSDGTVAVDDFGIIDNCVESGTGGFQKNCTFNTGIFTQAPIVVISACGNASDSNAENEVATSTGFIYYTRNLVNTQIRRGVCFTISKTGADLNRSQVIVGTFEGINSSDLTKVEAQGNAGETIAAVVAIPFIETKDSKNEWDGTTFTASSKGRFKFQGSTYASTSSGRGFYLYVDRGSGYVQEKIINTATNVNQQIAAFNGTLDLESGDKVQIRETTIGLTLLNDTRFHYLTITQSADTESIIENLNQNNFTECQTKFLQADTSSSGDIADLQFNNVVVGKKYSVSGQHFSVPNAILKITNGASNETISRTYENGSDTIDAFPHVIFTATDNTVKVNKENGGLITRGNGDRNETWVQLCELPDTTITNSNKWD